MVVSRRKTSSSAIMLAATICTVSSSLDSASAFVQPVRRSHAVRSTANLNDSISPLLYQYNYKRALPKTGIATPLYMSSTNGDDAKNNGAVQANNGSNGSNSKYPMEPQVYPQRWTQLVYLSLLALLSDWICFSVAASPDSFEHAYPGASAANLIDIFLFTNVASCFLVTDVVSKFGLEMSIKGAAGIMTLGCLLRSGIPDLTWLDKIGFTGLGTSIANAASDVISGGGGGGGSSSDLVDMVPQEVIDVLPDGISDQMDPSTLTEAARMADRKSVV